MKCIYLICCLCVDVFYYVVESLYDVVGIYKSHFVLFKSVVVCCVS